jgi:hypothetical protein
MQWQIVIELAGGIAEAIHRGECPSAGGVAVRDTQLPLRPEGGESRIE